MTDLLVQNVQNQIDDLGVTDQVEILTDIDNREVSIGFKRQRMYELAKGEYIVSIDSDDAIMTDYIAEIWRGIKEQPDCITFQISCSGTKGKTANVSNNYQDWMDSTDGFDYVRTPYHKVAIKRSIALQIGFIDLRYGEDYDFSKRLKKSGLITTEYHISKPLYHYKFRNEPFKQKYGFNRK
jgi:glycosyltransferase involved in cell wall biosynthesis